MILSAGLPFGASTRGQLRTPSRPDPAGGNERPEKSSAYPPSVLLCAIVAIPGGIDAELPVMRSGKVLSRRGFAYT
jgi:hypothetical protein